MSCPTCNHRMPDGSFCGSPALRGQRFCYFHNPQQPSQRQLAKNRRRADTLRLHFPPLQTWQDLQIALWEVMNALTDDRMDPARATALLFGLQQVSLHLQNGCSIPPVIPCGPQLPFFGNCGKASL